MTTVIVSPHLDDAVLSCGQLMASRPGECTVVTVFAGTPDPPFAGRYDQLCGLDDTAMAVRRGEDVTACRRLDAAVRHLPFLDAQYRDDLTGDAYGDLCSDVRHTLRELFDEFDRAELEVFVPLGIGQEDHRIVSSCATSALRRSTVQTAPPHAVHVYAEIPGWVMVDIDALAHRVEQRRRAERMMVPWSVTGHAFDKGRAVAAYRSQLWSFDVWALSAPERYWRVL